MLGTVTEVHVVGLRPLGIRNSFVNSVQQFVFDLRHRVTVQHLHRHLRPCLALRRDAHQSLRKGGRNGVIRLHGTSLWAFVARVRKTSSSTGC